MFNDPSSLEEATEKLNSVSPTFCMAKWMNTTIHLHMGRTHSCHLPPTHKIPLKEISKDVSALHNTQEKMKQRKMMLEGKRPKGCSTCWDIEDLPGKHYSDRHYRGQDSWTKPFFDKVKDTPWDQPINPSYLEVSFSAGCNFKCAYCSPTFSTAWQKEVEKHGGYPLSGAIKHHSPFWLKTQGLMPLEEEGNPYIEAFWKWWPDLKKDLMYYRITGGEPLLSKDTFKTFEMIDQDPMPELELSINSNLGIPQVHFDKFIKGANKLLQEKKIKHFMLHTSVDTYGAQAEYIRNGLNFPQYQKYVETFLEEVPSSSLAFMCTFNALSIDNYQPLLEWIITLRRKYHQKGRDIYLDIPHLKYPNFMAVQVLPHSYRGKMQKLIHFMKEHVDPIYGIKPAEVLKMERILKWMEETDSWEGSAQKQLETDRRNFSYFFKEHDRRRKTDFLSLFPDLKDLYEGV